MSLEAGNGNCSHTIRLLYTITPCLKLGLKPVPLVMSKTSWPQTSHIPSRGDSLLIQWNKEPLINQYYVKFCPTLSNNLSEINDDAHLCHFDQPRKMTNRLHLHLLQNFEYFHMDPASDNNTSNEAWARIWAFCCWTLCDAHKEQCLLLQICGYSMCTISRSIPR